MLKYCIEYNGQRIENISFADVKNICRRKENDVKFISVVVYDSHNLGVYVGMIYYKESTKEIKQRLKQSYYKAVEYNKRFAA